MEKCFFAADTIRKTSRLINFMMLLINSSYIIIEISGRHCTMLCACISRIRGEAALFNSFFFFYILFFAKKKKWHHHHIGIFSRSIIIILYGEGI